MENNNTMVKFGSGLTLPSGKTLPTAMPMAMRYTLTFDSGIEEPEKYTYFCQVLQQAKEGDLVEIFFNSYGGSASTMIMLLNFMENCQAHIRGHLVGSAHSAASILFINCDDHTVGRYTDMCCHTLRTGFGGKLPDCEEHLAHTKKQAMEILTDTYTGFVSEEELNLIKDGKEHYMDGEAIEKALERRKEHLESVKIEQAESNFTEMMDTFKKELPKKEDLKGISRANLIKFVTGEIMEVEELLATKDKK